ncbi:MAG TPA: hypothetical protein VFZ98_10970 [Vicinamibacterales bacterium]
MHRQVAGLLLSAMLTWMPVLAEAQTVWQPTPVPTVTAESEPWYLARNAIDWNGDFYYPSGTPQQFDRYGMVRAGSYRGIPVYTDTTVESDSIVYVPVAGGRVQPYLRSRPEMLTSASALAAMPGGFVAQAPVPPSISRPYDLAAGNQAAATSGQSASTTNRQVSTAVVQKGISNAWIEYGGRRWVADGKATPRTSGFVRVGTYRGFPVYERDSDQSTIYVPSTAELVVSYRASK